MRVFLESGLKKATDKVADEIPKLALNFAEKEIKQLWQNVTGETDKIKELNEAWTEAQHEAKLTIEPPILQTVITGKEVTGQYNTHIVNNLKESNLDMSGNQNHFQYKEDIKKAFELIADYQKTRKDRFLIGGRKGHDNDAIDVTLTIIKGMLVQLHIFATGSTYDRQMTLINFIKIFLNNFANKGDERREPVETVNHFLDSALKSLEKISINQSAQEHLNKISNIAKSIATGGLYLVAAITHPTTDTISCVFDIEAIANKKVFQPQVGTTRKQVDMDADNPFTNQIQALAQMISSISDKDKKELNKQTIQSTIQTGIKSPEEKEKYIYKYKSIISGHHPYIIQSIVPNKRGGSEFKNQKDEKIYARLNQFHLLIKFSSQMAAISKLTSMSANYAQNYGDIGIYVEQRGARVLEVLTQLLNSADVILNQYEELFFHIEKMKKSPTLGKDSDEYRKKYAEFANLILNLLKDIDVEKSKLLQKYRNSSAIQEQASATTDQLDKMLITLKELFLSSEKNTGEIDADTSKESKTPQSSNHSIAPPVLASSAMLSNPLNSNFTPPTNPVTPDQKNNPKENPTEKRDNIVEQPPLAAPTPAILDQTHIITAEFRKEVVEIGILAAGAKLYSKPFGMEYINEHFPKRIRYIILGIKESKPLYLSSQNPEWKPFDYCMRNTFILNFINLQSHQLLQRDFGQDPESAQFSLGWAGGEYFTLSTQKNGITYYLFVSSEPTGRVKYTELHPGDAGLFKLQSYENGQYFRITTKQWKDDAPLYADDNIARCQYRNTGERFRMGLSIFPQPKQKTSDNRLSLCMGISAL